MGVAFGLVRNHVSFFKGDKGAFASIGDSMDVIPGVMYIESTDSAEAVYRGGGHFL